MKSLFVFLLLFTLPIAASQAEHTLAQIPQVEEITLEPKWEPTEQDQLKIKLVSYQYLQAKDNGDFNTAFDVFSEKTKSATDFKKWKYNRLIFNATAGAVIDRTFTRISWYENSPDDATSGIFVTVDYSSIYTNIDIQCGTLMWHKKDDAVFELIREQENYLDKDAQKKLSATEIEQTKVKFGCKGQ